MVENSNQLVSIARLSAELGVSIGWLVEQVQSGQLPATRLDGVLFFNRKTVYGLLGDRAAQFPAAAMDPSGTTLM